MRNTAFLAAALLAAISLAGCSSGSGSGGSVEVNITCSVGTVEASCLSGLFRLREDGNDVTSELVSIYQGLPAPTNTGFEPSLTSTQTRVEFTDADQFGSMVIDWDDPTGNRPAFCMQLCPQNVFCFSRNICTRSIPDGLIQGTWRTELGYGAALAGPAGTTEALVFRVWPIVTNQPGLDPITVMEDAIANGDDISDNPPADVIIGQPLQLEHVFVAPGDTDSGGDDPGGSSGMCTDFGIANCGGADNVRQVDGLCHCCLLFNNACLSCSSSSDCDANTMCANNDVCVFNNGGSPLDF